MVEHRPWGGLGDGLHCGHILLGELILLRLQVHPRHFIIMDRWSCGYIGGCFVTVLSGGCFAALATLIMWILGAPADALPHLS